MLGIKRVQRELCYGSEIKVCLIHSIDNSEFLKRYFSILATCWESPKKLLKKKKKRYAWDSLADTDVICHLRPGNGDF